MAAITLAFVIALAGVSKAAVPPQLWQAPGDGEGGSGAGHLDNPYGMAAASLTGNLYISDSRNQRIDEFTPWGEFVKAWGWGVADGSSERLQSCTLSCFKGLEGDGAGEFDFPRGLAIDPSGDLYAFEEGNSRVQKFDSAGNFLLTFGGGVLNGGATGFANLTSGSTSATAVTTTSKAFAIGQALTGPGIAPETTIKAIGPDTIALSKAATATETGGELTAPIPPANSPNNEQQSVAIEGAPTGGTFTLSFSTAEPSVSSATTTPIPFDAGPTEVEEALEALVNIGPSSVVVTGAPGGPYAVEFEGSRFADTNVNQLSADATGLTPAGGISVKVKTTVEGASAGEVCDAAEVGEGYLCEAGVRGTGEGQVGVEAVQQMIAVSPSGLVYVGGDKGRIQEFNPNGTYKSEIKLPEEDTARALAVDPKSGDLYVGPDQNFIGAELPEKPNVLKLDPATGSVVSEIKVGFTRSLAVSSTGSLYVVALEKPESETAREEVLEFDSDGKAVIGPGSGFAYSGFALNSIATSSACNLPSDDIFISAYSSLLDAGTRSNVSAYGPAPDPAICPPPPKPPTIGASYATAVNTDSAIVRAEINPRFWADTGYWVEYGTGKCSEGGCKVLPEEELGSAAGVPVRTAGVFLSGLSSAARYHYRFVAKSGGGGPAIGEERTFSTPAISAESNAACPNRDFRTGASAMLPDCRAYEMVSPVDKNNGDIVASCNNLCNPAGFDQSSVSGGAFTYSSYRAFGAAQSSPYSSQYLSTRGEDGWDNKSISPPRGVNILGAADTTETEFRAFSPDLCEAWIVHDSDPLTADAPAGYTGLYRRQDCGEESYEALSTAQPHLEPAALFAPELQGVSSDRRCVVFRVRDHLTADANPGTNYQLYESCGGQLRLLSALPGGIASAQDASMGTVNSLSEIRTASVNRAISQDGLRIYWSASIEGHLDQLAGGIYLRENPEQPQSAISGGKCSEAGKACTVAVSETVTAVPAQYWTATPDGSKAFFSVPRGAPQAGNLYEFNAKTKKSKLIAGKVLGSMLGASEDASRIYFASEEALAPGGVAGRPNVYLDDGGDFRFVAALSGADVESPHSAINPEPINHLARISPDGTQLAFMSSSEVLSEQVAGYDNSDVSSGEADAEVYLYDASADEGAGRLVCVSCNPTGARPAGRPLMEGPYGVGIRAAAQIPSSESQLYSQRALSENGQRLFFDSFEALVPQDTNGTQDVYEWEATGSGDCKAESPSFSPGAGGCIALISSGESPQDSEFVDASPSGSDVFLATSASLLPQDPGLVDIYDARVEGGFPPLPSTPPACEGEACQGPLSPPNDPTPASAAFQGAGNVVEKPARKAKRPKHIHKKHHKKKSRHHGRAK
jgi:hypothetical protein